MEKKKIIVLIPVEDRHKICLEQAAGDSELIYRKSFELTYLEAQSANIIIGDVPAKLVKDSKNLELLQLNSAGTGEYVNEGVLPEGVLLTNATGAYGPALSEHMLALTLMLLKKLHFYRDNQSKCEWKDEGNVKSIFDSTTLILGLGDIGGEYAKKMKALGSRTIGIRRTGKYKPEYLDELYHMDELEKILPRADIVAISLPGTKETYHVIDEKRIGLMKKGAVLVNVGRGTVIDTEALCDALLRGEISGAALDVTEPEPLPKNHRIWKIPNAVITPHIAGGFHMQETLDRIVSISTENIEAFLKGRELKNIVDFSTGYRKLNE